MKKKVSQDELSLYNSCPFKHLYRYVYGVDAVMVDAISLRVEALKQTILWMYTEYGASKEVALASVFSKFEESLETLANKLKIDKQSLAVQTAFGRNLLYKWYKELQDYVVVGVSVPWEYDINTGNKQVAVYGSIDIVRIKNDGTSSRKIQAIHLETDRRYVPSEMEKSNSVDIICTRLGMYSLGSNLYKKYNREVEIVWACLYSEKVSEVEVKPELVKTSVAWIANIAQAIEEKLYYPQYQKFKCETCPYMPGCNPKHAGFDALHNKSKIRNLLSKQIE